MRDLDGISLILKSILKYNDIKDLYLDADKSKLDLNTRDLEYLIHYLKTDNSIQKIEIYNYRYNNHNYGEKIINMYKSNITIQEFKINNKDQFSCQINKNIWEDYKKFYRQKIKEEIPTIEDMRNQISTFMSENDFTVSRFKSKEDMIDMNDLENFIRFLQNDYKRNIESIKKIKRKMVQIKKVDLKKKGIVSILSNLRVLYWMKQETQNELDNKLKLLNH